MYCCIVFNLKVQNMKTTSTLMKAYAFTLLCLLLPLISSAGEDDLWALICPDDVTANCTDELWDLSIYGNAQYHDYHGYHDAGTPTESYHLSQCNTGYIYRTWTVEDPNWNWVSCTQTITVTSGYYGSFGANNIHWPDNTTVEGCSPDTDPYITGEPTWDHITCSMIGVSYHDKVFTVNGGCSKIVRQWTIMDWCQTAGPYGSYKTWTHNQTIKIINNDPPTFTCIDDITATSKNCKNAFVQAEDIVIDDSACDAAVQITNDSPYAISGGANISGTYPIGKTKVTIYIKYGCGRVKACEVNVYVVNDGGPVPICIGELSVALMGMDTDGDGVNDEGMVEIWAKDLDHKSYDPCHTSAHLRYSFSEDVDSMFRIFTCDEVGENIVRMYVTDYAGNQNYCEVTVDVQNNSANIQDCERPDTTGTISVGGRVMAHDIGINNLSLELTPMEDLVEYYTRIDTTINITRDSFLNGAGWWIYTEAHDSVFTAVLDSNIILMDTYQTTTQEDGHYLLEGLAPIDIQYMVKCINQVEAPTKELDFADINALVAHLLNDRPFTAARQYLAADMDEDGYVTFQDAVILFDVIQEGYKSNQAVWTLAYNIASLEANYKAIETAKDWVMIDGLMENKELEMFTAVQKGDVFDGDDTALVPDYAVNSREQLQNWKNDLRVAPNPFNDRLTFFYQAATDGEVMIEVSDVSGRIIYASSQDVHMGDNTFMLDLSTAPKGVLIYTLTNGLDIKSGKVIRL